MKRWITIEMEIANEELNVIVPSGTVAVRITNSEGKEISDFSAEIIQVENVD